MGTVLLVLGLNRMTAMVKKLLAVQLQLQIIQGFQVFFVTNCVEL